MLLLLAALLIYSTVGDPLSSKENNHLQSTCGQNVLFKTPAHPRTKSMHTKPSNRNNAPFTVLIRVSTRNGSIEERLARSADLCTGTLISSRHILTAAHCLASKILVSCEGSRINHFTPYFEASGVNYIDKLDYFLVVAPTFCNKTKCDTVFKNNAILPKRAFISKNWIRNFCKKKGNMRGDVAVIELAEDVAFSKALHPACLYDQKIKPGITVTIYGYGRTNGNMPSTSGTVRKHSTVTLPRKECEDYHPRPDPNGIFTHPDGSFRFLEDEICSSDGEAMACVGDSGSGLIIQRNKRVYVTAVSSYGPPCNPDAKLRRDTSAALFYHLDWISEATGIYPGQMRLKNLEETKKKYVTVELRNNFRLQKVDKID